MAYLHSNITDLVFFLFIAFAEFIFATAAATIIIVTNFTFQSGTHNSFQTDLTDVDF